MEESKFNQVAPGQFVLNPSGDYVQVPDGEPLKMHISKIETVLTKKYESDEMEEKLAISFKLDEDIEGKGQVYSAWFKPSLNPKAKLTPLVLALYSGKLPEGSWDVTEMLGLPVRVVLTPGTDKKGTGKLRQYVDSFLKPDKNQTKVEYAAEEEEGRVNLDEVFV